MSNMTKEELELEIDMLKNNICTLIGLGQEASEHRKKLAEYRAELLSLTRTKDNTNQEGKGLGDVDDKVKKVEFLPVEDKLAEAASRPL